MKQTRVYIRVLYQRHVNFSTPCHNIVLRGLDILQNITVLHSINKYVCKGLLGQEVEDTLEALVVHMHSRVWEINPQNIQEPINIQ